MIENNSKIQNMLDNIITMCSIIKFDLIANNKTHSDYMKEKLAIAKWDLNVLIEMINNKENIEE